jgi:phosphate uptake regulator
MKKFADKIISRLSVLDKLLSNENVNDAVKLIARDESINKLYKSQIKKYSKQTTKRSDLSDEQKVNVKLGFILALKNFESAGDAIKEIAESIIFITTGDFTYQNEED